METNKDQKPHVYEFDQLSNNALHSPENFQRLTEFTLHGIQSGTRELRYGDHDPVTYILNSDGFRGPEFGPVKLLAAGCSQTFGIGIKKEEDTWASLLAKMLDVSYANISRPGSSNASIVHSVISYIKKYGNPEIVCVNLPSLYRFTLPTRDDINNYKYIYNHQEKNTTTAGNSNNSPVYVQDLNMTPTGTEADDVVNWPIYGKRPYDITKVIPYEAALYLSMMEINHLIEYCRVAGIDLVFTTWYEDTAKFFSYKLDRINSLDTVSFNQMDMSSYVVLDDLHKVIHDANKFVRCHKNVEDKPDWDHGLDRTRHMGAHMHIHFAEMFYKKIVEMRKANE